jgi:hypothetical protein
MTADPSTENGRLRSGRSIRSRPRPALSLSVLGAVLLVGLATGRASAHVGALRQGGRSSTVPFWLIVVTGGGIIAASFLFASLVTDRETIHDVNRRSLSLPSLPADASRLVGRPLGVVALIGVVLVGLLGPSDPTRNAAVLFVWAGWWAGYTITVYSLGNTWSAFDPWHALASRLPTVGRSYPDSWGTWPSVVGLLALVWIELVLPVAQNPRLLAAVVVGYTVLTLGGASVYGSEVWFDRVDPVARVFRYYGLLAPIQRTADGLELRLPGAALAERASAFGADDTAFVVTLLWVTTSDGLVATATWATVAEGVVGVGVPPLLVYLLAHLAGFGLFLGVYRLAARLSRTQATTYVSAPFIAGWFAAALLPIAAGYHLAHFLEYFLTLAPALAGALLPVSSLVARQLVLPSWFGIVQLAFVLLGHLLAIWVAHVASFELFTGRLQPIRSQYPFIAVMVFYTMSSMWIIAQPYVAPPYL